MNEVAAAVPATQAAPATPAAQGRALIAYLTLCFGATWTLTLAAYFAGMRMAPRPTPASGLIAATCMLLPAASAFIVRRSGRFAPLPDAGLRLGPWRAYLAVWLIAPLFMFVTFALPALFGLAQFGFSPALVSGAAAMGMSPEKALALSLVSSATINVLATSLFAFGEEYGWTGLLLPLLLARGLSPVRAACVYGAIWGAWHWPIIWAGHNYPGQPVQGSVLMVLMCIALALMQTALRLRTGSVLVTAFAHGALNVYANGIGLGFTGYDNRFAGPTGLFAIVLLAALGLFLLRGRPGTGSGSF